MESGCYGLYRLKGGRGIANFCGNAGVSDYSGSIGEIEKCRSKMTNGEGRQLAGRGKDDSEAVIQLGKAAVTEPDEIPVPSPLWGRVRVGGGCDFSEFTSTPTRPPPQWGREKIG